MNRRDKTALCLATGLSVGRVPFAPGTFGSLLALPICAGLARLEFGMAAIATAAFLAAAVWAADRAETLLGRKDAPEVVVDEIAGMLIALAGLPFTVFNAAAGFAVAGRAVLRIERAPIRRIGRADRLRGRGGGLSRSRQGGQQNDCG